MFDTTAVTEYYNLKEVLSIGGQPDRMYIGTKNVPWNIAKCQGN